MDRDSGGCGDLKQKWTKTGVDNMMARLGLSAHNKDGMVVKLFDYMSDDGEEFQESDEKMRGKGTGELKNLKWDMRDKENMDSSRGEEG